VYEVSEVNEVKKLKFPTSMNCEKISKIKPEVTSPIPSCRRGDNYRSRACTHTVLPLQGESEEVKREGKFN